MDECQVALLADGDVMINMRNDHATDCHCRGVARSSDDGVTFSLLEYDGYLVEPVCQGSFLQVGNKSYFANPGTAGLGDRSHMTVRLSTDGARNWEKSVLVNGDAPAAYSSLSEVDDNNIGLAWEVGDERGECEGASCVIVFALIPPDL